MKRIVSLAILFGAAALLLGAVLAWRGAAISKVEESLAAARANLGARDQGVTTLRALDALGRTSAPPERVHDLMARVQQEVEQDAEVSAALASAARQLGDGAGRGWLLLTGLAVLVMGAAFVRLFVLARRLEAGTVRAEEGLRSLRSLLAAAPTAFVAWNPERGLVLWSDSAERMFGVSRGHVLGQPLPQELEPLRTEVEQALATASAASGLPITLRTARDGMLHLAVSASRMHLQDGSTPTIAVVVEDVTPHREREARRVQELRAQRDALIREVHHRIKNHLQGVAGLLRQHLSGKPALQPLLEAATSQVLTIAAVHGLQGELRGRALDLRSMVSRIAASISGIMRAPIVLSDSCLALEDVCLAEDEAVSMAMVLNEILMNAVKHRAQGDTEAMIRIASRREHAAVRIRVDNPGTLPTGFDFVRGIGLGTGLGLVKSLLPPQGVTLDIAQAGDRVVAELTLSPDTFAPAPRAFAVEAVAESGR